MSDINSIDVKIVVATHKEYRMPEDKMYIPIHVGAEGKKDGKGNELNLGYVKDSSGDNISRLNANFCELTGLYWAWKNLEYEYLGLVHYRRHFVCHRSKDLFGSILTYKELKPYLKKIRVFVPGKRKYYIETLYEHYKHTHYASHLDETRNILSEIFPEYVSCFDKVVHRTYGYMFNMMIMERELVDDYCLWLFTILFELRKRINDSELSAFQGRLYGRVSEIIFNVWLEFQIQNQKIKNDEIMEIPVMYMEKINWVKKGTAFVRAKLFHKKYESSF